MKNGGEVFQNLKSVFQQNADHSVVLIEATAGAGKTSLTTMSIIHWAIGKNTVPENIELWLVLFPEDRTIGEHPTNLHEWVLTVSGSFESEEEIFAQFSYEKLASLCKEGKVLIWLHG